MNQKIIVAFWLDGGSRNYVPAEVSGGDFLFGSRRIELSETARKLLMDGEHIKSLKEDDLNFQRMFTRDEAVAQFLPRQ